MAFKKVNDYNNDKFGGLFLLRNDGDTADVIFMYRSVDDVLVADTHYVKSADYSGYVHCTGRGCPACGKNIRVQTKLFIPMFNITAGELQFWDRTMRFENQLQQDVFAKYPNPSEFVFRITRHGVANDVNTTYSIMAIGRNTYKSYNEILAENNIKYPDHYESVCKDVSAAELTAMLNSGNSNGGSSSSGNAMPEYQATPRVAFNAASGATSVLAYGGNGVEVPNFAEDDDDEDGYEPPVEAPVANGAAAEGDGTGEAEELDEPVDF